MRKFNKKYLLGMGSLSIAAVTPMSFLYSTSNLKANKSNSNKLNNNQSSSDFVNNNSINFHGVKGLPENETITSQIQDKDGNTWVGTQSGLFRSTNENVFNQISGIKNITKIYMDNNDNIWVVSSTKSKAELWNPTKVLDSLLKFQT